jgi:peptidoglycan-N-acetylmuramic acid deacetylase
LKNKKIILTATILIILANLFNALVAAHEQPKLPELIENKNYSWYFKPVPENRQPDFDVSLEEIKNYGAYALGNKDDKVIYLTFDFGFENGNVKKCLDALNKNDVKGAFFILENVVRKTPELLKEMAETGHIICNHTLKHKNMCDIKKKH